MGEKRSDRISLGEMFRSIRRDYDEAHATAEDGTEPSCVIEFELSADAALFTPEGGPDAVELDFNEPKQSAKISLKIKPSAPLLTRLAVAAKVLEQKRLLAAQAELLAGAESATSHVERTEGT